MFIVRLWGLQTPRQMHSSVISETTASLLTPHCCLGLVISSHRLLFLSPTWKRSTEMIKWAFLGRPTCSHWECWIAFIKSYCSNQYLCDCSVITDNETYRTNRVSPHRRRSSAVPEEKLSWKTALNKVTWRKACLCVQRWIEWEGGGVSEKTERSKFGSRAPVYVTSDLRHFWEPTPSQHSLLCVCVWLCLNISWDYFIS